MTKGEKYWRGTIVVCGSERWEYYPKILYSQTIHFVTHNGQMPYAVMLHYLMKNDIADEKVCVRYVEENDASGGPFFEVKTQDEVVYELRFSSSARPNYGKKLFKYPDFEAGRMNAIIAKAFIDGGKKAFIDGGKYVCRYD